MIMNNQVILHKRSTTTDMYGKYTYAQSYIKCRMEARQATFKDKNGKDTLSRGILYTRELVKLGDKITWNDNTFTIEHIYDTINLEGTLQFRKCYLI